jgi:transposase-like protein
MSRVQTDPLRSLPEQERRELETLRRSRAAPAAQVARARALLAVAAGQSYTAVAHVVGRQNGDTVRDWVSRFNREGVSAVVPRHGGGPPIRYTEEQERRLLAEVQRTPVNAGSPAGRHGHVVVEHPAEGTPADREEFRDGEHVHPLDHLAAGGPELAKEPHVV